MQAELSVDFRLPITERLSLRAGASASWAAAEYVQAYFGVTAAQAAATTFRAYTPKAGLRKAELSVGALYSLASQWKLQGSVAASLLRGGGPVRGSDVARRTRGAGARQGVGGHAEDLASLERPHGDINPPVKMHQRAPRQLNRGGNAHRDTSAKHPRCRSPGRCP